MRRKKLGWVLIGVGIGWPVLLQLTSLMPAMATLGWILLGGIMIGVLGWLLAGRPRWGW